MKALIYKIIYGAMLLSLSSCASPSARNRGEGASCEGNRYPANLSCATAFEDSRQPPIDGLQGATRRFRNGAKYTYIQMQPEIERLPQYRDFLRTSVEVIYLPSGPFGHTALRIGEEYFSFNGVRDFSQRAYSVRTGKPGVKSAAFLGKPEDIDRARASIEEMAKNSREHNVPPYDVDSPKLEIIEEVDGRLRYRSPSDTSLGKTLVNNDYIDAELVKQGSESFLRTPSGYEYPVEVSQGKYFIQSLSCASSTTEILSKKLKIRIPFTDSAKQLAKRLFEGNVEGSSPSVIISYE